MIMMMTQILLIKSYMIRTVFFSGFHHFQLKHSLQNEIQEILYHI